MTDLTSQQMISKRCLNRRFLIQAVVVTFLFGCVVMYYCPTVFEQLNFYNHSYKTGIINLRVLMKQEFYQENCFDGKFENTLDQLPENLLKWSKAYNRKCQILWKKFHTIFKVNVKEGKLNFPSPFIEKVRQWLGNNDELFRELHDQKVIQVSNQYSHEQTIFNLLRSKRPTSSSHRDPREYVDKLDAETRKSCDFCQYKTMTAEDIFGRIEGQHSASASNAFKLEKWHGLFLSKKHNPVDLTEEEFLDLFNTSLKWFKKANSVDRDSNYPMMIYDSLPKAGASQFHPHAHGFLASQYLSLLAIQHNAAINYDESNSEYWNDLIEIHHCLGLTVTLGDAVAISPLTPVREHEIMIFSNHPGTDLFRLFYYVIQTYYHMKHMCFSTGLAFPVMNSDSNTASLPAIVRIGTRSDCSASTNDVSSLELYVTQNVHVDPYVIIKNLQQTVKRLGKISSFITERMVELS